MIEIEKIEVMNWEAALRGMRNPMNSWDRSDSVLCKDSAGNNVFSIGDNDLGLMQRLCKGGSVHRKFMRMIFVSMDITAPLYWWKEFDTYKVGTVANSCSTMHKIHSKEFVLDDFSHDYLLDDWGSDAEIIAMNGGDYFNTALSFLDEIIDVLNKFRELYIKTKDKCYWWQMIQLLPSSYNQKRTVTFSYENAAEFINQRSGHKLDEWNKFVAVLLELPYLKEMLQL